MLAAAAARQGFLLLQRPAVTSRRARTSAAHFLSRSLSATATSVPDTPSADAPKPLSLCFSAGGLLFPYYVGVCEALVEAKVLNDATQLAGASAGSLIAAAVATKVPSSVMLDCLKDFSADLRKFGTRGRLKEAVQKTLLQILPDDAFELANQRGVYVAVSRFTGTRLVSDLHSHWESNDDFSQCLLASCHIPFYFSGISAGTRYRGDWVCDGGATNFLPVPPGAQNVIRVCCFPAYSAAAAIGAPELIDIAPDAPDASGAPIDAPYSTARMIQWALTPADDDTMSILRDNGRADALRWVERQATRQKDTADAS